RGGRGLLPVALGEGALQVGVAAPLGGEQRRQLGFAARRELGGPAGRAPGHRRLLAGGDRTLLSGPATRPSGGRGRLGVPRNFADLGWLGLGAVQRQRASAARSLSA